MVAPAGIEPALTANLAFEFIKLVVLPITLWGHVFVCFATTNIGCCSRGPKMVRAGGLEPPRYKTDGFYVPL